MHLIKVKFNCVESADVAVAAEKSRVTSFVCVFVLVCLTFICPLAVSSYDNVFERLHNNLARRNPSLQPQSNFKPSRRKGSVIKPRQRSGLTMVGGSVMIRPRSNSSTNRVAQRVKERLLARRRLKSKQKQAKQSNTNANTATATATATTSSATTSSSSTNSSASTSPETVGIASTIPVGQVVAVEKDTAEPQDGNKSNATEDLQDKVGSADGLTKEPAVSPDSVNEKVEASDEQTAVTDTETSQRKSQSATDAVASEPDDATDESKKDPTEVVDDHSDDSVTVEDPVTADGSSNSSEPAVQPNQDTAESKSDVEKDLSEPERANEVPAATTNQQQELPAEDDTTAKTNDTDDRPREPTTEEEEATVADNGDSQPSSAADNKQYSEHFNSDELNVDLVGLFPDEDN